MAGEFCGILSSIPGDHGSSPLFYPNTVIPSISVVCFKQKSVWFLDPVPGLASYSSASSSPFFTKTPSARLGLLWLCHLSLIFSKLFFLVHLIYCVCVCAHSWMHMCVHTHKCAYEHINTQHGAHMRIRRQLEEISSLLLWILGVKFQSLDLVASTFTCGTNSLILPDIIDS